MLIDLLGWLDCSNIFSKTKNYFENSKTKLDLFLDDNFFIPGSGWTEQEFAIRKKIKEIKTLKYKRIIFNLL